MDYAAESLRLHYEWRGKIEIRSKVPVRNQEDLSLAYTPGVAAPCLAIARDPDLVYELTGRWNTVAVITDGSAVLGLGDIGPEAAMPVMEGKCVLFKEFGRVDAIPLCIRTRDVDAIVETVALLAGSFGGINLEDIAAPRCFEIERRLKERCDIPVFHDDQHGTAIVTLAALLNALRVVGKDIEAVRVVMSGAGAAGAAIALLLMKMGLRDVVLCDRQGALYAGRPGMNDEKIALSKVTNPHKRRGSLAEMLKGTDVFIGVSAPGLVTPDMVRTMAERAILFPMANPVPEIMPDLARDAGAAVVGTGRSDFPNQINNVLAFPGVFRGALDARASDINDAMQIAAATALAARVTDGDLSSDHILPAPFEAGVGAAVANAVEEAAHTTGVARCREPALI
ncbi:MAG: NADP-dependent malic enzyme [Planctomycetes bacterium]|nr:NADP-dependent malic enzyme [Planctomycetota bacterium]